MRRGVAVSKSKKINWRVKVFLSSMNNFQGPRSNFEIGGGGGGTIHFFLLTLYNFKNIWRGACAPLPPAVPDFTIMICEVNVFVARYMNVDTTSCLWGGGGGTVGYLNFNRMT